MKKSLFGSFVSLTLILSNANAVLPADDHLSVIAPVPNARALRQGHYEPEINQMKQNLGVRKDTAGYNWEVKMSSDADAHISFITFQRAPYTLAHLEALTGIMGGAVALPQQGYFLRPELWTLGVNADGSPRRIHWVHQGDLTLNEQNGQLFDPSVRSLNQLNRDSDAIKEARIVFRYATQAQLSRSMQGVLNALQDAPNAIVRELNERRDDYGPNLIAHLSVARIIRAKEGKFADAQEIKNNNLVNLETAFAALRTSFKQKAAMPNPFNPEDKVIPFNISELQVTQGVRDKREVLHSFH